MEYYIVCNDPKFVYCVIPKVACTSLKMALAPAFGIDTAGMEIPRQNKLPRFVIHEVFNQSGHQVLGKKNLEDRIESFGDHFKFGFVRNPWDRLVSCYKDKIVGAGHVIKSSTSGPQRFYRNMPFSEFVEVVSETPDEDAEMHYSSQHRVLLAGDKLLVDFVGRFELLAGDFAHVSKRTGFNFRLPHVLSTGGETYRSFYNKRLRNLVAERFKKDVELFNYSF